MIIFAIAANVVAGVSTIAVGALDDRLGAKPVIIAALIGLIISGLLVFFLHDGGQIVFWTAGLALCLFVGPAQSASRTFLARIIPPGREGEVFGLYATTGRAVSFLAPTMFAIFVTRRRRRVLRHPRHRARARARPRAADPREGRAGAPARLNRRVYFFLA